MRRLISITAFVVVLVFPLWAQRGGGRFGGLHNGFSHSARFDGTHFSGSHPGMTRRFANGTSIARGPYLHNGSPNNGYPNLHRRFRGDRFRAHNLHFRNYCYGYPCQAGYGYPWWGYDPWLGWDSDSSNYDDDYSQNLAIANEMNRQSLAEQRMRLHEQAEDQQLYEPPPSSAARSGQSLGSRDGDSIVPPTVLIFRDRHTEEIQNYAIIGETLWNFNGQRAKKIPLSELDLVATEKANDDRGVTFTVPTTSPGQ